LVGISRKRVHRFRLYRGPSGRLRGFRVEGPTIRRHRLARPAIPSQPKGMDR
jgi:hypothetical protein